MQLPLRFIGMPLISRELWPLKKIFQTVTDSMGLGKKNGRTFAGENA
jgi:hypothetical protein